MRRTLIVCCLGLVPLFAVAGLAMAGGGESSLSEARAATAAFHDVEAAKAAGYTVELTESRANGGLTDGSCISNKDAAAGGAMGVHMVNPSLVGDGVIDAAHPEALLYEKRNNGTFKLIGVEYVSPDPGHSVFGLSLAPTDVSRFFGAGATLYTLHAWIWKPNPNGIFNAWNSRVTCG
jgi:hypothetical protein